MKNREVDAYPEWFPQYKAAMLELDRTQLEQRIVSAHAAITERVRRLAQGDFGTSEERTAMAAALNGLAAVERVVKTIRARGQQVPGSA